MRSAPYGAAPCIDFRGVCPHPGGPVLDQLLVLPSVASPPAAARSDFRCTLRESGRNASWIRVAGELDLATAPQLERALCEAKVRARSVVLDLRALTFMDCAGVGVIVRSNQRAKRMGRRLVLVRGPAQVHCLFALSGTADGLEIVDLDLCEPPVQALVNVGRQDVA